MAILELKNIAKRFGETQVLNDIDLTINEGEFITLLGPSGCGKTTTLRIISGLEAPDSGSVILEGADVTDTVPNKRNVNTVFQNYALFPHMNVESNVGYSLKIRKVPKGEIKEKVSKVLEMVQLSDFGKRRPGELSGGQKQRVALARALIHRPGLLLLDEPLGALDALTRLEMQDLIVSLWQEHGFTVLLVTHDVSEAVAMADRVLLIEEGKIGLDLTVDIPRPRRVGSAKLAELEAEVLDRVMKRGETELQRVKANA